MVSIMSPSLDLSILIVNWNSKDYLRACLASIYRETSGLDYEVIVVDNASWDGAAEMIAAEFPQVKFIQSEENLGFARGNNLAFDRSRGKVVLLLNPDTEIIGKAVPTMMEVLTNTPDAGIVGCRNLQGDLSLITASVRKFPSILQEVLGMEWLRRAWPTCGLWSIGVLFKEHRGPVQVDAVTGACQLIRREVYETVGGLSTKYFMYAEDVEISAAALAKGWKTYYAGNAEIIHHGGKSTHSSGRGDRWISIMQRHAVWQFHRAWRGKSYAALYRATIAGMSVLWLIAAVLMWPALFILGKKDAASRVWRKWSGAFLWSIGLENLTRKFRGQVAGGKHEVSAAPERSGPTGECDSCDKEPSDDRSIDTMSRPARSAYVLMTAAYNEEECIRKTIESLLAQSQLPERWVIVSDGSTDQTDEIIQEYAGKYQFIRFLRVERAPGRSFGSKVRALRAGSALLNDVNFNFVGNLDADITIPSDYFRDLIARFDEDPMLGLAAGFVRDKRGTAFYDNKSNRTYAPAHGAQLVRRSCYEEIGGYAVLEHGGEDWHAQISAEMRGWKARSYPDLPMFHERPTGEGDVVLHYKFREGRMDYSLGSDPIFEVLKCVGRITEKPFLVGAAARWCGFSWSYIRRERRPVSNQFVSFVRNDQRQRLSMLLRGRSRGGLGQGSTGQV
jgi:GT2 family glycosyltransferase